MKAVFFEPLAIYSPHFEACLEIIQDHLDKGSSITFIGCDASLPACEPNPKHNLGICLKCISRRKQGLQRLDGWQVIKYLSLDDLLLTAIDDQDGANWNFAEIKELNQYRVNGSDVGMAVASTLISQYRDPTPDLVTCQTEMKSFLSAATRVYYAFNDYLTKNHVDKVYLFNGRFSFLRSVLRVCQQHGVDFATHERGCNTSKYEQYNNALPHSIELFEKRLRKSWSEATPEVRNDIAEKFYHDSAGGKELAWLSFSAKQTAGLLPDNWQPDRTNIVIFSSSEDEYAAIGKEWEIQIYDNQIDAIKKIVSDLSEQNGMHLYLRVHPNLKNVNNESVSALYAIASNNFTIIHAESKVSTYSLLHAADKVITFGSTVGIEAVFWGIPSISAGMSFYRNLGSVYLPSSHEELIEMAAADLPAKDPTGALMYGYYMNTFGIEFKYFVPDGLFSGFYKGKKIKATFITRVLALTARIPILKLALPIWINLVKKRNER